MHLVLLYYTDHVRNWLDGADGEHAFMKLCIANLSFTMDLLQYVKFFPFST